MRDPRSDDGRVALLDELDRYEASDAREREMAARVRAFVAANADCFERSLTIGHVTGSAWIVARERDAALLVHHRKLGIWVQPGGHADGESDVRAVARREAIEETGVEALERASTGIYDIDVHAIAARPGEPAHEHFDLRFAFFAERSSIPVVSEESHAVAWIAFADIEKYRIDESVRRLVRKTALLG